MLFRIFTAAFAALYLSTTAPGAQSAPASSATSSSGPIERSVDQLFAQWAEPSSPGAVIAVLRDGKIIYSQGYGAANLELGVPNTPSTVFHLASVSKQFTAFAIHLLAQEGKLSLDDDVRKYVPKLHEFGKPITIRHLLHHTSGVRDQWNLLALAGWRLDDEITDDDVARLLFQQTGLNFAPGDQFLYSNSGYTLLAMVVKQVAGQTLPEFAKERIFEPLGMSHTRFQDKYGTIVKDRAYSYGRQPDGKYQYVALTYSTVGPSSLFSTVGDLARWDENFYTGDVGGPTLLAEMQQKGKLNNGSEINYASGLTIGRYRGLRIVEHAGGDAAYRTNILRFPDQHFSVVILANAGDLNPTALSFRIADIYLKELLKPARARPELDDKPEVTVDPKILDAYVGDYELRPGFIISISKDNDHLVERATGQSSFPMYAVSNTAFRLRVVPAEIVFDAVGQDGKAQNAVLHQNGANLPLKRITIENPRADRLKAYEGHYYSAELGVIYDVFFHEDVLTVHYPRGDLDLQPVGVDAFTTDFPIGNLKFACADDGRCNAMLIDDGRVKQLRFDKTSLDPIGPRSSQ
ncbi:serine hydrolase [Bradyrhizobium sp. INPA01-394B]|uniref:Serine hydrolase n=1 Tax=Bradyrhizobium campsiandrae TaxID=1729892 RepID=A0ABR7UM48_9BRAD|nr:serine hydrolase [Bradyrhizobium campsiandrae]MBC9881829.1 serine hydrolase [Bradyrhizobium campsiandrae]MBC9984223.1 serine hydrolase [Bradyrhizobium campsiandrae]